MAIVPYVAPIDGMEMPDLDTLAENAAEGDLPKTAGMTELLENAAEGWSLGRVIIVDGNPWFRGHDVATSLGYKDQQRTIYRHVRPKHKTTFEDLLQKGKLNQLPLVQNQLPLGNQQPHELYVNEPGLYSLIFRSKLPKAEEFTDWVFEEVLPAIRKTGRYVQATGDSTKSQDFTAASDPQATPTSGISTDVVKLFSDMLQKDRGDVLQRNTAHFRVLIEDILLPYLSSHTKPMFDELKQEIQRHSNFAELASQRQDSLLTKVGGLLAMNDVAEKRGACIQRSVGELEMKSAEMISRVEDVAGRISGVATDISDQDKVGSLAHQVNELRNLHDELVKHTAIERQVIDLANPQSIRAKTELMEIGTPLNAQELKDLNKEEGVVKIATWFRHCYFDLLTTPPPAEEDLDYFGLFPEEPAAASTQSKAQGAADDQRQRYFSNMSSAKNKTVFNRCRWLFIKEAKQKKIDAAVAAGGKPLRLFFCQGGWRIVYTNTADSEMLESTFEVLKETNFPEIAIAEDLKRKRASEEFESTFSKKPRHAADENTSEPEAHRQASSES